ncbi:MAG: hypothetical protein ACFHWX_05835 [Bacteroidota bacterium]
MELHNSYEESIQRKADFRVKYRFYSEQEGGRFSLPHQGIRSDFWYEHPDHEKGELFMIWPEFEDENGDLILDKSVPINIMGTARMWIINKDYIDYHKGKIKVGTKGYFKEGSHSTGECEVVELLNIG